VRRWCFGLRAVEASDGAEMEVERPRPGDLSGIVPPMGVGGEWKRMI
jgi:hypothetical protein